MRIKTSLPIVLSLGLLASPLFASCNGCEPDHGSQYEEAQNDADRARQTNNPVTALLRKLTDPINGKKDETDG